MASHVHYILLSFESAAARILQAALMPLLWAWCASAVAEPKSNFTPVASADLYAAYSTAAGINNRRPYVTQASHVDSMRVNLLSFGGVFDDGQLRGAFVGQYGDSVDRNYLREDAQEVRFLQQGYLGGYLTESISIDVGVFPSYLGAESWISSYNPVCTRSFTAEFSPYYDSGVRMNYQHSEHLSTGLFLLNGWQNISDAAHPALGGKVALGFGQLTIASNAFLGAEEGGARVFHDLALTRTFDEGAEVVSTFDIGHQNAEESRGGWWWGANLMGRAPIHPNLSLSARLELFQDPSGVVADSETNNPFRAYATSLGLDVLVIGSLTVRCEIKRVFALYDIFIEHTSQERNETMSVVSLSYLHQ